MLRYKADLRTLTFVAIYFSLVAVQWLVPGLSVLGDGPWTTKTFTGDFGGSFATAIPLLVATAMFSFFGAVATHNTIHAPVFRSRPLNRIFQVVLTLTYGHPVSAFVPGHNLSHHKHTQTARDVMRTSKVRFKIHLLNVLLFMVAVGPAVMKGERNYFKAMSKRAPKWYRQMWIERAVLWAFYIGLLILDWRKFLLFVLIPHQYAAWGIITINMIQHDGCDARSEYNHSRNFVGKLVNFFTFNNGYHSIHHKQPGLHWSLLPEAHAKEFSPHIDPALEQPSLIAYLVKTFIWPGKRLRYDGTPMEVPAAVPDEDWIPRPDETPEDLGAIPA